MPVLQLDSLECRAQEDWVGVDECRLVINPDHGTKGIDTVQDLQKNLRDGDVWDVNRTVEFEHGVQVSLWELDEPVDHSVLINLDADDYIDQFEVSSTAVDRIDAKQVLVGDGAEYWVQYSLTGCSGEDPSLAPYVASVNSLHYQRTSCSYACRIRRENKLGFSGAEAAQRSGRHACERCKL